MFGYIEVKRKVLDRTRDSNGIEFRQQFPVGYFTFRENASNHTAIITCEGIDYDCLDSYEEVKDMIAIEYKEMRV